MGVILAENVRDVGYASGKISWRTLRHPENGKLVVHCLTVNRKTIGKRIFGIADT